MNNTPEPSDAPAFGRFGLTPLEWSILKTVADGHTVLPRRLLAVGSFLSGHQSTNEKSAAVEAFEAVGDLLHRGILRTISPTERLAIEGTLRERKVIGPVAGLPRIGALDFTDQGVQLWRYICESNPVDPTPGGGVFSTSKTQRAALYCCDPAFESLQSPQDWERVGERVEVGPWRAEPWRRLESGFCSEWVRTDSSSRKEILPHEITFSDEIRGIWSKYPGMTMTQLFSSSWFSTEELPLFEFILRSHGTTKEEWETLRRFETRLRSPGEYSLVYSLPKEYGQGPTACIDHGWIVRVDSTFREWSFAHIASDSALAPLRHRYAFSDGTLALTSEGFEKLSNISADIYGPLWQQSIQLQYSLRWSGEIHAESEAGDDAQIQGWLRVRGTLVREEREPIGRWCDKWWREYPSGIKATVEIDNVSTGFHHTSQ